MMPARSNRLTTSETTLTGNLGGRPLNCVIQPPQGGGPPPPGKYHISPPVDDPIYGRIAVMVRMGTAGGGTGSAAQAFDPGPDPSVGPQVQAARSFDRPKVNQQPIQPTLVLVAVADEELPHNTKW